MLQSPALRHFIYTYPVNVCSGRLRRNTWMTTYCCIAAVIIRGWKFSASRCPPYTGRMTRATVSQAASGYPVTPLRCVCLFLRHFARFHIASYNTPAASAYGIVQSASEKRRVTNTDRFTVTLKYLYCQHSVTVWAYVKIFIRHCTPPHISFSTAMLCRERLICLSERKKAGKRLLF